MYVLGYDIGSSSVKSALVEIGTGRTVTSDFYPKMEMATLTLPVFHGLYWKII